MEGSIFGAGFVIGLFVANIFSALVIYPDIRQQVMAEAYSYGYVVECIGKEGYYWECEPTEK